MTHAATFWARDLGLGNTLFKNVRRGRRFTFDRRGGEVLTKTGPTTYRDAAGTKFRTGKLAAVWTFDADAGAAQRWDGTHHGDRETNAR